MVKMLTHAREGSPLEIMGLLVGIYISSPPTNSSTNNPSPTPTSYQGVSEKGAFIITDAFRLPVEGTETRVNAQEEAMEYMVNFKDYTEQSGRPERVVGWYHSHPDYGCWLSGIDVTTQATSQRHEDPFVAVVVDPDRSVNGGKVEIGAFRTFPDNYKPPPLSTTISSSSTSTSTKVGSIPSEKEADFGAHADKYYPLTVTHFKSSLDKIVLDQLWNKYWINTISSNPLRTARDSNTRQVEDLVGKMDMAREMVKLLKTSNGQGGGVFSHISQRGWNTSNATSESNSKVGTNVVNNVNNNIATRRTQIKKDKELDEVRTLTHKIMTEERLGKMTNEIKEKVFHVESDGNDERGHVQMQH